MQHNKITIPNYKYLNKIFVTYHTLHEWLITLSSLKEVRSKPTSKSWNSSLNHSTKRFLFLCILQSNPIYQKHYIHVKSSLMISILITFASFIKIVLKSTLKEKGKTEILFVNQLFHTSSTLNMKTHTKIKFKPRLKSYKTIFSPYRIKP